METILKKLKEAKRPLILAGHGVRAGYAVKAFRNVLSEWNIPVVTTQLARDLLPAYHPLYIGTPGVKGDRAGGKAIQNADVILILGCSLHPTTTGYELHQFAPRAFKIQVDIDPLVLRKNESILQYAYVASVGDFIREAKISCDSSKWQYDCLKSKYMYHLKFEANRNEPIEAPINYYDVIDALGDLAPHNATLIADAGSAFYITGQAYRARDQQRVILPGGLAQMGYTTSAMIGACFADPSHMVIGLVGDGSIQTNIHDLGVIKHHDLNAKIIVLNNGGYSCIRNTQERYFKGPYSGVDKESGVSWPDFVKLARAYRIPHTVIDSKCQLKEALENAFKWAGPCMLEIETKRDQEIEPVVQSQVMPDGTMKSGSLDHMFPFLNEDTMAAKASSSIG